MPMISNSMERLSVPPKIIKGMGTQYQRRYDEEPGLGYQNTLVSYIYKLSLLCLAYYCVTANQTKPAYFWSVDDEKHFQQTNHVILKKSPNQLMWSVFSLNLHRTLFLHIANSLHISIIQQQITQQLHTFIYVL